MNLFVILIIFPFINNVIGAPFPVCQFILSGKCLGDPMKKNDFGFPHTNATRIATYNDSNFKSCIEFCNLNVSCHMAAFNTEENHCDLYKGTGYQSNMASPIHLYIWNCCNTNNSYEVNNRCPGYWIQTLQFVSDNKNRKSDPLIEFNDKNEDQCMLRCLEIGVCGAINVAVDTMTPVCQLIMQFPVEDLYTSKNSSMYTFQWACASNYSIPEPSKQCVPREHHSDGHWSIQDKSKVLGNDTEYLINFYTLDYQKCLDNCALYKNCIRAWYSLKTFYCVLEANTKSDCSYLSPSRSYSFTTFVWSSCATKTLFENINIDNSINDCHTLENNDGVFLYPIKCGYPLTNSLEHYPCSTHITAPYGTTFSYSLQCQNKQSFRVLDRGVMTNLIFSNVTSYRVYTGYEDFWLVNVTDEKLKVDERKNRCKFFDSSMHVSGLSELKIINRTEWFAPKPTDSQRPFPPFPVKYLIISDTENPACNCFTIEACSSIMRRLQENMRPDFSSIPYNFVVTGDGVAYEARGWDFAPAIAKARYNPNSLAIALCGQYHHTPNLKSLSSVKQLINMAIKLNKVSDNYTLYLYNDLRDRQYPFAGLRRVIALWPRYREHTRPDCRPITSLGLIMNVVSCIVCLLIITLLFDIFVLKIWHKSQCFLFRKCRIDTIYSNACENNTMILPKTVMHTINDLNLDKKYFSTFLSPVYWIEDFEPINSGRSTVDKCSCRSAIFTILDLCRVQNKLVNVGSLRLLPEVRCCSRLIGFVFQLKEELGDEYLAILHFSNKNLFHKCLTNLHENKCVCYNNNLITYKFTMCYNVTEFKNVRKTPFLSKINQIKRNDLEDKYTFAIKSNGLVTDYL